MTGAFHVLFMKGSCVYSSMKQCLQSVNHGQFSIQMTQNSKHNKWLDIFDFQPKLLWRTPTKIHRERGRRRRRQPEAAGKAQRISLSTAKATSSTQRPQTCTEAATKYYNYTTNEADEEREHRLPTLQKAMGRSGNTHSSQHRQPKLCGSYLDFEFIRECMKINKIRLKFQFCTQIEIKMTYLCLCFVILLSLRL